MILDLERFQVQAGPRWRDLESLLAVLESRPGRRVSPPEAEQLQELYAQVAADLNRVTHGALAPELRQYLERLVARAYAELYYAPPMRSEVWQPRGWLRIFTGVPRNVPTQRSLFRSGCADHVVRLCVRRTGGALRSCLGGCVASGRLFAQSRPARA